MDALVGDFGRAEAELGWRPVVTAPRLAEIMVDHDVAALTSERGHEVDVVEWNS